MSGPVLQMDPGGAGGADETEIFIQDRAVRGNKSNVGIQCGR